MRRLALAALATLVLAPAARADGSLAVRAALTPRSQLFGEPVTAEVEVVVDPTAAGTVRVRPDFRPYAIVGGPEVTRVDGGDRVELHYRYRLDCLQRACLPGDTRRRVVFSPVHVRVLAEGRVQDATATWPPLIVRSRLAPEDLARPQLRTSVYPVGSVSWRVAPGLLVWGLAAVASALALAALVLLAHVLVGLRLPWRRSAFDRLAPVERALALVRLSARRGDLAWRRRALERLGHELETHGRIELGAEACRLAWSEEAPDEQAVVVLAGRVEAELRRAS